MVRHHHSELDCAQCVVSDYVASEESFCNRCCNRSDSKQFCIALYDSHQRLAPFVALNDGAQAQLYADRLEARDVPYILIRWNAEKKHFTEVRQFSAAVLNTHVRSARIHQGAQV